MEALIEYAVFLAKTVTLVLALVFVLTAVGAVAQRSRSDKRGHISVEKLNDQYEAYETLLRESVLDKKAFKSWSKDKKKADKKAEKKTSQSESLPSAGAQSEPDKQESSSEKATSDTHSSDPQKPDPQKPEENQKNVFVLEFDGDVRASAAEALAEEITAILTMADPKQDEVVVKIESPGGVVHGYGLAASQLDRIKRKGIKLVVSIDKVAASGGYLMAVIADKILASPFAVVGSIGVVAQLPNFHRLLKKHDVDVELHTAGEFKRTLTVFGQNTDKGREKFREELEDVHVLFKDFIAEHRPQVDLAEVATGEHWFGTRALQHNLVDQLITSDEYLVETAKKAHVFSVSYEAKESIVDRLGHQLRLLARRTLKAGYEL